MIQPTIKEKIDKLQDEFLEEIDQSIEDEKQYFCIEDLTLDIARLICEEMTGKKEDIYAPIDLVRQGYNERIEEEKQKAQEILKALGWIGVKIKALVAFISSIDIFCIQYLTDRRLSEQAIRAGDDATA